MLRSNITRRDFISSAAKLGVGLSSASLLAEVVAACAQAPAPSASATGGEISFAVHQFLWPDLKTVLEEFKKQSGTTVNLAAVPSAGGDQITQLTPQFSAGSTPNDVITLADESAPEFIRAGWLEPLDDIWNEVKHDFEPAVVSYVELWSSYKGHVYRIPGPTGWSVGFYWVRRDVLDQLGVAPPATWDDILALGAKAASKGMWAFADAVSVPSLAFVYMAYLCAQSGGKIFDFDAGTRAAFAFAKELVDKGYFPRAGLNWTYDQLNSSYIADKIVTMREWNFFDGVARGATTWYQPAKAEVILPVAGPGGRGTWAGAWGYSIPKFTKNMGQAKNFVRFIVSPSVNVALTKLNQSNWIMPRQSVFSALQGQGFLKHIQEYSKAGVVKTRPYHPKVSQAQSVVDSMVSGYLSGQLTLDQAMSQGKSRIGQLG